MPTYSVQTRGGSEIGRTTSKSRARALAKKTADAHNEPVQIVWEASVYGRRSYRNLWIKPSRRKNPMHKRIVGVALNPSGKFLGFIDGGGRIRKGRLRRVRVRNPGTMATLSQVQAADRAGEHSGRDSGPASTTAIKREFNSWFNYRKDSLGLAGLNHLQKRQLWGAFIRGFRRGAR